MRRKSHSTVNDVRHGVSTVRPLHMRYQKKKPWKRISLLSSPRSRPRKTRASKSKSYQERPECPPEDRSRRQDTTCMQTKGQRYLPEDKQLSEPELPSGYLTTPTEELHHEAV